MLKNNNKIKKKKKKNQKPKKKKKKKKEGKILIGCFQLEIFWCFNLMWQVVIAWLLLC
jgi:hypothetical protein